MPPLNDNIDEFILNNLINKFGAENINAILWEIKKIYKIEDFGIDPSILSDFEDDLLGNISLKTKTQVKF